MGQRILDDFAGGVFRIELGERVPFGFVGQFLCTAFFRVNINNDANRFQWLSRVIELRGRAQGGTRGTVRSGQRCVSQLPRRELL